MSKTPLPLVLFPDAGYHSNKHVSCYVCNVMILSTLIFVIHQIHCVLQISYYKDQSRYIRFILFITLPLMIKGFNPLLFVIAARLLTLLRSGGKSIYSNTCIQISILSIPMILELSSSTFSGAGTSITSCTV